MLAAFEVNDHNIAFHVKYVMKENVVREVREFGFFLAILLFEYFILKGIYIRISGYLI